MLILARIARAGLTAFIVASLLVIVVTAIALAHTSASGQVFPLSCCRGDDVGGDCHMISADDVKMQPDGSYVILATGERFVVPGTEHDGQKAYRWSTDGMWYRCNVDPKDPKTMTYCLFVPAPGS